MSLIFNAVNAYWRCFGGDGGPGGLVERRFMQLHVPPAGRLADVGGGEGRLARELAKPDRPVIVLDREETLLVGADNSIYRGSLARLVQHSVGLPIVAIRGDAMAFPFAAESLDGIVSCQLLEHLDRSGRQRFFEESARCLRNGGRLVISTPNSAIFQIRRYWFSKLARRLIPSGKRKSLPLSLQGPWLIHSIEEWEAKVGHVEHGCPADELAGQARAAGFVKRDDRATHTNLTAFWLELTFTFPLLAMLAAPWIRILYEIEWRLPPRPGGNLLMAFEKKTLEES
jgi:SAM-dependent methyltransferase